MSGAPIVDLGREFAISGLEASHATIAALSHEQQVQWFAGYVAGAMGFAVGMVGPEAVALLRNEITSRAQELVRKVQQ